MILTYPIYFAINPQYAHAIGTKVATQVATQAVKEVIKDAAKEQAFKMALDEVGKIYDPNNKYKFKDGYEGYCVEVKKPDGSCDKPIQIKKDITEVDQKKLDDSVSKKLDQKIGGQLYNTKWGKYLDYVIPIYAVSAVGATVDYAINGEDSIAGLMNEVAMEALQDAGIIQEAELAYPDIVDGENNIISQGEKVVVEANGYQTVPYNDHYELYYSHTGSTSTIAENRTRVDLFSDVGAAGFVFEIISEYRKPYVNQLDTVLYWGLAATSNEPYRPMFFVWEDNIQYTQEIGKTTIYYNDELIHSLDSGAGGSQIIINNPIIEDSPIVKTLLYYPHLPKPGTTRPETKSHIFYLENGDVVTINWYGTFQRQPTDLYIRQRVAHGDAVAVRFMQYPDGQLQYSPFVPDWSIVASDIRPVPIDETIFRKDDETITLPPIASMEYTGLNGQPLNIIKDPETGETGFTDQNGTPVNEDSVTVAPGTGYTKTPEGITYTPTNPTPENPTRQPETFIVNPPETETPTDPNNPNPDPQPDPNNPPPTIPDGESCDEGFKFPELTPLVASMEDNFPLSIPFDIHAAFEAAFGQMGDDKPEWDLALAGAEMKIKIPDFFDDMKPFTDSLLLFIFNIGMIFGIMRIMKGMN